MDDYFEVVAISAGIAVAVVVSAVALVGHAQKTTHAFNTRPLPQASTAGPHYPSHTIRRVLAGNGIGAVRFGQSDVAVIAGLAPLLGRPSPGHTRTPAECGVDHTMTWPNWPTVSGRGMHHSPDPVLTAFFWHGRFVGYQYGDYGTPAAPRAPARGTVLATTRGLGIGDTLARGKRLYGGAFTLSSAQGGTFAVTTPRGRIDGYAWGHPSYGDVSLQSVVATIDAGDVGCPALSP